MADLTKMTPMEQRFHQECLEAGETLRKQHKYNPTYFLQMVHEHGAVDAVRLLLKAPNYQDGLTRLWSLRQLRLSIEAAIINPRWTSLFTEAEKSEARKRLKSLKYDPATDKYEVKT